MGVNTQAKNANFSVYQIEDNLKQKWLFNLSDAEQPGMRSTNSQFSTLSNCQSFMQRFSQASSASQLQRLQQDIQKRTKIQPAGASSSTLAALLLSGSLSARPSTAQGGAMSVYIPVREKEPAEVVEEVDASADEEERGKQEVYDLHLEFLYSDDQSGVEGVDYKVTLSDGSVRAGRLGASGKETLHDVPTGMHEVVFGYPEVEEELTEARAELKSLLDELIDAVATRGDMLDQALAKENIALRGLILTGAFFDGLFDVASDSADGIKKLSDELAQEARVKLDNWEDTTDELKQQAIDFVQDKKEDLLEFVAEVDEKRQAVEDALTTGDTTKLKSEMEELATYAQDQADNLHAYGVSTLEELTATFNHYALIFEDDEAGQMLKDLPGRYYDAMPSVEAAQIGGGIGFNVLTAVLTGGAGAGIAIAGMVASKAGLFVKTAKTVDKLLEKLGRKKKTPDSSINKSHNETAKAEAEKTKEEELEEKDKKLCKTCNKEYNRKCPMDEKERASKGDHERDEALYRAQIEKSYNNYPEDHPWYDGDNSIQIHHVIDIKAVEELGKEFKQFDYNINHAHNLIVLPSKMHMACRLAVPLHLGKHSLGRAIGDNEKDHNVAKLDAAEKGGDYKTVVKKETKFDTYPKATQEEMRGILELLEKGKFCYDEKGKPLSEKKVKQQFIEQMNATSNKILKRISDFVWTINRDGRDYKPGNPCGCSDVDNMGDKIKVRGTHCTNAEHRRAKDPDSEQTTEPNEAITLIMGQ